ncbi:MAG: serine/threonine-protein kinase [Polyangiaceae bacterium]
MKRGLALVPRVAAPEEWTTGMRRRRFGQRLGRYCLGALVGSGGAASVYMARLDGPHGFERLLALKIVHEHLLGDRDFVAMFLDEANLASQLQHPNIVHSYELCQDQDSLYLAMEYLQGQPLSRVYRRALESNQPLPYGLVAWLGARAAEALAYAHSATGSDGEPLRLVHRDVSPDNLFISYDGQLKLLDFGIARAAHRLAQTNMGQIKGKLRYMAPEYTLGHEFDGALDVFALGATLYEAALGVPAFEGDEQAVVRRVLLGTVRDPRELRPDFPAELWRIIQGMLEPDPKLRLGPAALLARELDTLASLNSAQGRALLALTMERLFREDREKDLADIAELRGLRRSPEDSPEHSLVQARSAPNRTRRFRNLALLAALSLLVSMAMFLLIRRAAPRQSVPPVASPRVPLSTPALRTSVDIAVVVTPPGIAELSIEIGGVSVPSAEPHRLVTRDEQPLSVRVTAPGYLGVEMNVVPERDRSLLLPLMRLPEAGPSGSAKTARSRQITPAPEASGVIQRYPF